MPKCTRQGCQKEFNENENEDGACHYHSGRPIFHEGLKSWSCCEDVHRPVLDFDSFMLIPGCTPGKHTAATDLPVPKPMQTSGVNGPGGANTVSIKTNADGKEVFSTGGSGLTPASKSETQNIVKSSDGRSTPLPPATVVEDEDDLEAKVEPGKKCLRNACKHTFVSDEVSRGAGDQSECTYHPMPPLFHEGSKGYLCCKRRVLEFEEFLKIEGCKKGKHLFIKKNRDEMGGATEELVQCRIDHYQTPGQVRASVYAKKCDKERSTVTFDVEQVHLDLYLPDSKRFKRTLDLYGRIDPSACSYVVLGTKVDLILAKQDTRSWNLLERTNADLGGYTLTFGVGGRTGTVGAKEPILDEDNKTKE